jgi:hypothetical protein
MMRQGQPDKNHHGLIFVFAIAVFVFSNATSAQTITLYQNDFESPNVPAVLACGYALDTRAINTLYGGQGGDFEQINTVETVLINEPAAFGTPQEYADPEAKGGNYAIGMLSALQNDRLSLTFDGQGLPFVNIGLDISSIDVYGCGGPFGVAAPSYRISLLDSPGGVFNWNNTVLDEVVITGEAAPDQWTFHWTRHVVALDASGSVDGNISIVWDLIQSGYGAFDNLIVTSSVDPGDVTYSVGGIVSGLKGSVTLQNNGGDDLALVSDGPFMFSTELDDGAQYSVSVLTQPIGQTCTVGSGSGTISGANVSNVAVDCVDDVAPTYSVATTVSVGSGSASCNPATVSAGGSSVCTAVPDAGWQVSGWTGACAAAGTSETCTLDNIQADQTSEVSFEVIPVATYPIEFTVSGLLEGPTPGDAAYSVVLSNNGGDEITVLSDGVYSFPTELPDGAGYDIAIAFQPDNQTCTVTNGSGTVAAAPVTDPAVTCVDNVAPPVAVEAVPVPVDSRAALVLLTIITMVLGLTALSNRHS